MTNLKTPENQSGELSLEQLKDAAGGLAQANQAPNLIPRQKEGVERPKEQLCPSDSHPVGL